MPDETSAPELSKPPLWDRLLHTNNRWSPWFNLIGVAGFIFGVYQWTQSEVEVDPTMIVDPQRTTLIERERLKDAPVKVVRRDGTPVDRDVTGVRVYFWNDGRKPMVGGEILEPFRLVAQEPAEILDFRVVKASRPKITQLAVQRVDGTNNQLALGYRVLEREEGLSLQLVIAGEPSAALKIEGAALGAQSVTDLDTVHAKHRWRWFLAEPPSWLIVPSALIGVTASYLLGRRKGRRHQLELRSSAIDLAARVRSKTLGSALIGLGLGLAIGTFAYRAAYPATHRNSAAWALNLVPAALLETPREQK